MKSKYLRLEYNPVNPVNLSEVMMFLPSINAKFDLDTNIWLAGKLGKPCKRTTAKEVIWYFLGSGQTNDLFCKLKKAQQTKLIEMVDKLIECYSDNYKNHPVVKKLIGFKLIHSK